MMTCRDEVGRGLSGIIDGVNALYRTSFAMRLERPIEVFVNGLCRMAELDNGYELLDPFTVRLKEALLPGDTLAIRYNSSQLASAPPYAQPLRPIVASEGLLAAPTIALDRLLPPKVSHEGCPCVD